jgi:hypothetical protein
MKQSAKIFGELQTALTRIRELNAEADACQPIRREWRLTDKEGAENDRRATRLDQIAAELRKANAEASKLRREYSLAMADEQQPRPAAPAKSATEIPKLRKQIAEAEASIADLPDSKRPHVIPAARGDKKALAALDQIAAVEDTAINRIEIARAAIAEIETQNAEVQREFAERDADAKFVAAQSAAAEVTAHDHSTDIMMRALAEHLAKRPALLRAIRKTGCEIDDARMNVLATVEVLHRAAKAAGLADILHISIRDAVPLEDAARTLLRLAIRRPEVKGKAAA